MEVIAGYINIFFLLSAPIILLMRRVWSGESAKGYIAISKSFIVMDLLLLIFSHDANTLPIYFVNEDFSLAIYVLTAVMMYVWLSLSLKWFTSSGLPSCSFCVVAVLLLFCIKMLLMSANLGIISALLISVLLLQYMLLRFSQENEEFHNISGKYLLSVALCTLLLGVSLYMFGPENWALIKAVKIVQSSLMPEPLILIGGLLIIMLFMLGIAPLHFGITDSVGPAVLPVAAYFTFIPTLALWTVFIKLNILVFAPLSTQLEQFYICLGVLSAIIGAIGANSNRNLRRIFAFMALFNLGIILIIMSSFEYQSIVNGICGLIFYILTCLGVYTALYGFKSQGEYLSTLNTMSGFFKVRPFISLALAFFLLSISNVALFPGFVNLWELLYMLTTRQLYVLIIIILVSVLLLLTSLFQIIRAVFFMRRSNSFDRAEFNVYLFLVLNLLLQIWLMFNVGTVSEAVNNLLSEMVS